MTIILGESSAIPGNQFTIITTPAGRTMMIAEASTVGYHAPRQIYDDAADVGIAIRSHKSGKVMRFYLSSEDHDASGEDVAGWWFKMIPEDRRKLSAACREIEVLIIND